MNPIPDFDLINHSSVCKWKFEIKNISNPTSLRQNNSPYQGRKFSSLLPPDKGAPRRGGGLHRLVNFLFDNRLKKNIYQYIIFYEISNMNDLKFVKYNRNLKYFARENRENSTKRE